MAGEMRQGVSPQCFMTLMTNDTLICGFRFICMVEEMEGDDLQSLSLSIGLINGWAKTGVDGPLRWLGVEMLIPGIADFVITTSGTCTSVFLALTRCVRK
jgi:hypothetical protein